MWFDGAKVTSNDASGWVAASVVLTSFVLRPAGRDDASEVDVALQDAERRPLVIKPIPAARSAAPPPQPVPVEHSSAFLLQSRQQAVSGPL